MKRNQSLTKPNEIAEVKRHLAPSRRVGANPMESVPFIRIWIIATILKPGFKPSEMDNKYAK